MNGSPHYDETSGKMRVRFANPRRVAIMRRWKDTRQTQYREWFSEAETSDFLRAGLPLHLSPERQRKEGRTYYEGMKYIRERRREVKSYEKQGFSHEDAIGKAVDAKRALFDYLKERNRVSKDSDGETGFADKYKWDDEHWEEREEYRGHRLVFGW